MRGQGGRPEDVEEDCHGAGEGVGEYWGGGAECVCGVALPRWEEEPSVGSLPSFLPSLRPSLSSFRFEGG